MVTNSNCGPKRTPGQWKVMRRFLDLQTYNGHIHSVRVGVGEVAEQEERVVLGQASRVVEVPQLKADVLHRCSLHREKNSVERTPGAVQEAALHPQPPGG